MLKEVGQALHKTRASPSGVLEILSLIHSKQTSPNFLNPLICHQSALFHFQRSNGGKLRVWCRFRPRPWPLRDASCPRTSAMKLGPPPEARAVLPTTRADGDPPDATKAPIFRGQHVRSSARWPFWDRSGRRRIRRSGKVVGRRFGPLAICLRPGDNVHGFCAIKERDYAFDTGTF